MNLEEELEEIKREKNQQQMGENSDIANIIKELSQEQIEAIRKLKSSDNKGEESKDDVGTYREGFTFPKEESGKTSENDESKENIGNYKDNYVYPREESESIDNSFGKPKNEFLMQKKQEPTVFSKLYDDAYNSLNEELDIGVKYRGRIIDVKFDFSNYESIIVNYEVYDNDTIRHVTDCYSFGGDYDKWAMNRLVVFLTSIDGFYKDDINAYTVEEMVAQMKFLIGSNIVLAQYQNDKGYRKNQVTIMGSFDRFNRRVVDK